MLVSNASHCIALKARGHKFEFDHQFSAEIVPFKQSYIERNFRPPIIFRDIKELSIPGAVDAYVKRFQRRVVDISNTIQDNRIWE
jgi:hypothetical protein